MPSPRRRYAPHPQKNSLSLRTSAHTGVAIRTPPRTAPSLHGGNGFPRRCAPRNDIFMKMRCPWTGGAEPPPLRMFCKFLCRAAPMCAAARHASHPQQNPCHCEPVRTPVWQSVLLLHRTSNLCVGVGFYPARSAALSQLSPVGRHPCVPPPDRHCTSNGGAHWPRPTGKNKNRAQGTMPTSSRRSLPHILLRTRRGRRPRRPACMNFQIMRRAG